MSKQQSNGDPPRSERKRERGLINAARRQVRQAEPRAGDPKPEAAALDTPGPGESPTQAKAPAEDGTLESVTLESPANAGAPFAGLLPDSFAGYQIVKEIHRGGQGVVYQAIQKTTKRRVALKVMREGPFAGMRDKARFEREVQILGALNHPNIVAIHDSGEAAGHFYFVMDYISGQPLDVYMASGQRSIDETLRLFAKICEAVNAAHLRGVIHRDLKPGNIRVGPDGEPHILDFGLAKTVMGETTNGTRPQVMTMTGQFIGSLPWASPEQAEGAPGKIDIRTDVYSLGVILYQMLTEKFPYEVIGNMRDVLDRIIKAAPARPSTIRKQINDEVETIVLKCLAKERERRYQTAGELGRDVRHFLNGDPIEAKRDSAWYVLRKSMRRYRVPVAVAIAFLALIVASTVALSVMYAGQVRLRQHAETQSAIAKQEANKATAFRDFLVDTLSSAGPARVGRKVSVVEALGKAAETIHERFGGDPETAAALRATIAETYYGLGLFDAAETHFVDALETRRRVLGDTHRDTLQSLNDLAVLRFVQGKRTDGLTLLRDALSKRRVALGDEDRDTLESINNLAVFFQMQGQWPEAETLLREAIEIQKRQLGVEHEETLRSMNNLAALFQSQGKLPEAEELLRQVIELGRRVLRPDHPDTLSWQNNLALVLRDQGRGEEALTLLRQVCESRLRVLGEEHVETLATMNNLALVLRELSKPTEAEELMHKALEIRQRVLGRSHPDTLGSIGNLALLLQEQGRLEEAEPLVMEALEVRRESLGPEHHETLIAMNNLADLHMRQGKVEAAETVFSELVMTAERALPPGHWHTGMFKSYYGVCLTRLQRFPDAETQLLAAHEALKAAVGEDHPYTRTAQKRLVRLYEAWGRPEYAEKYRLESPATRQAQASQPATEDSDNPE